MNDKLKKLQEQLRKEGELYWNDIDNDERYHNDVKYGLHERAFAFVLQENIEDDYSFEKIFDFLDEKKLDRIFDYELSYFNLIVGATWGESQLMIDENSIRKYAMWAYNDIDNTLKRDDIGSNEYRDTLNYIKDSIQQTLGNNSIVKVEGTWIDYENKWFDDTIVVYPDKNDDKSFQILSPQDIETLKEKETIDVETVHNLGLVAYGMCNSDENCPAEVLMNKYKRMSFVYDPKTKTDIHLLPQTVIDILKKEIVQKGEFSYEAEKYLKNVISVDEWKNRKNEKYKNINNNKER